MPDPATDSPILFSHNHCDGTPYAEITLNRPEKGNALTIPMLQRLDAIVSEIESDREMRAIIVRGKGRFFCTGGDIEAWSCLSPEEMRRDWILYGIDVFARLAALPQPIVAVLSGHALGGGLELAMTADLRIALQSAKLGTPEAALGTIPGWMGIRRLAEIIGPARARHMVLLGAPITAQQALEWGLITGLAEDQADLDRQLQSWLERLCANAPLSMALAKDILSTMHADLRHQHGRAAAAAQSSEDLKEGVRAWREKRKPVFRNR
jgi:enoyl-CoA hydratase